ncbi:MAG TPA: hypothetical protein VF779_07430 [Pyrinomonadaceae bacterium]
MSFHEFGGPRPLWPTGLFLCSLSMPPRVKFESFARGGIERHIIPALLTIPGCGSRRETGRAWSQPSKAARLIEMEVSLSPAYLFRT